MKKHFIFIVIFYLLHFRGSDDETTVSLNMVLAPYTVIQVVLFPVKVIFLYNFIDILKAFKDFYLPFLHHYHWYLRRIAEFY